MTPRNDPTWFALAAILAALGVAAGAFGAHGLRERIPLTALAIFETGARYHLIHAVGLLGVALVRMHFPGRLATASAWLLFFGIIVFSGSLYVLALTGIGWLGAITPFGGAAFIAGWICLAVAAWRGSRAERGYSSS